MQDGSVYLIPAEFGDLDFRQSEIVNAKELGNAKEVLDEMAITSNVIVTKSDVVELQIEFELKNVGVCTFVASKGKEQSLPNETFADATKIMHVNYEKN